MIASLYIHVPFCAGACDYCDFYSLELNPAAGGEVDPRLDVFVERLLADARDTLAIHKPLYVPTVYIGGGTPSVLGAARVKKLLDGLAKLLPEGARGAYAPEEFTVEVNPESADEEFLSVCRGGGVNRVSVGVQSFYEPSRSAVRRVGDLSAVQRCLTLVSRYYPQAYSADLIAGLPLQTEAVLKSDIERLLTFKPAHVSLYALTLAEGTPLQRRVRAGGARGIDPCLPEEEAADSLWLTGAEKLVDAGFYQYEVSNFARRGKESLHNTRYWRMENWLGLGPGASGTVIDDSSGTGRRYTVTPDLDAWLRGRAVIHEEALDRVTLMKESFLMGFRYAAGPDTRLFRQRFGLDIAAAIPRTLEKWRNSGCLEADKIALNRAGRAVLDRFLVDAFAEIDGLR